MAVRREYPSKEFLDGLFIYEPETGKLINRINRGTRAKAGKEAGHAKPPCLRRGLTYRTLRVGEMDMLAHVVVWIMNVGPIPKGKEIDHEDGDGLNNRMDNLSVVSHVGNMRNTALPKNNKSGKMGVYRQGFRWIARIKHNGKNITVGCFKDKAKAIAARTAAEKRFGYHPNHGKIRPGFEPDVTPGWAEYFWA